MLPRLHGLRKESPSLECYLSGQDSDSGSHDMNDNRNNHDNMILIIIEVPPTILKDNAVKLLQLPWDEVTSIKRCSLFREVVN